MGLLKVLQVVFSSSGNNLKNLAGEEWMMPYLKGLKD
jgi:hypothetical protein